MAKRGSRKKTTYSVGYGKPPKDTQFAKGQSGNPSGRPKGKKNHATIFIKACEELVLVKGKDGTKRIMKIEAACTQLANKAAGGDLRAIGELLIGYQQACEQGRLLNPPNLTINFVPQQNRTEGDPKSSLRNAPKTAAEPG